MTQQEKRISIFQFIYKHLVLETGTEQAKKDLFEKYDFEPTFEKIGEYSLDHKEEIFEKIVTFLKPGWTISRLAKTEQAILLSAFAETKISDVDRKIIINEFVNITKRFGSNDSSYKLINALLEKVL